MSLSACFQRAVSLGVLTQEEGRQLTERYNDMISGGLSNQAARDRMARQIQAEADHRERAALIQTVALDRILANMERFRDMKRRPDAATAFVAHHEDMGDKGSFIQDATNLQQSIFQLAEADMKDVLRELRRGAFSGDLRREINPRVRALQQNIVKEISGQSTGDTRAAMLAKAWIDTAEKLRVRFNEAGGAIGKLQGGYLPQSHDRLALLSFGRQPWIEFMMEPGRLDRDRMLDQFTGEKLTDAQLRRALGTAWDRITTDGYYDADVSGAPQGKGALYTQHMDHRFLHFNGPEKWLEYSKRFGNGGDVYAAMMGHLQIMARDIAHMETFGPNPNRTREYIKEKLRADAAKMQSNETVIAEQQQNLRELAARLTQPNPEFERLNERLGQIHLEIDGIRRKYAPQLGGRPSQRNKAKLDALTAELDQVTREIIPYWNGTKEVTVDDKAVAAEMSALLDIMREPIKSMAGRAGDRAIGWVNAKIRRADAMWDTMRGGEVGDPKMAAVMQSTRNVVASGALGSAIWSSITDPAWGQHMRMRLGMGIVKSNFARIMILNIKEMITLGSREDAIASGLGLDSGQRVLHRHAREMAGWDHRFWTSYLADRVLTTGMLLPWTQAGKHMFGLDVMRYVGKLQQTAWGDLDPAVRGYMETNGIGRREWAALQVIDRHDGIWLRPADVAASNRALAERYLTMILRATKHAIPEATVESSSIIANREPAGTLTGEFLRSMMQFKGFAFAMMMLHPMRIARELGAGDARQRFDVASQAATMFITSTMLGMVALAMKDIKDGRDPRKWLDESTWLDPFYVSEAILQAGGLGILGDFIRASENRMGGGIAGTIAGPLAGKAENLFHAVAPGQLGRWYRGKEVTTEEDLVRFFRSGVVPFSNHTLTAALYQRAIMDQIQKLADPKAHAAFQRKINERQRDYGQGHWYPPGQMWPQRAPDLTRPFATR